MKIARRRVLRLVASAAALPALSRMARAQAYPTRPITMIVPLAAGNTFDALARILAERMGLSLRQPIIIDNVGGADGSIGAGRAARARPDGYTIDLGFLGNHVLNGGVYSLTYDVLNDFSPIVPLTALPGILVARKSLLAKDLNE
jgi:tripartite-type tricarboxylate transporter receptor subunit TctC